MGFRFQRRVRIAPGVRLNLSKSGIGGSIGRTSLRVGIDAKQRKYFSLGVPGTGLSYRAVIDQRWTPAILKTVGLIAALLCFAVLVILATR